MTGNMRRTTIITRKESLEKGGGRVVMTSYRFGGGRVVMTSYRFGYMLFNCFYR